MSIAPFPAWRSKGLVLRIADAIEHLEGAASYARWVELAEPLGQAMVNADIPLADVDAEMERLSWAIGEVLARRAFRREHGFDAPT